MKICAWKSKLHFQALFFVCLSTAMLATSWAEDTENFRVAAVIYKGSDSMALVETASGEQAWFRVGDVLGAASVTAIDADGILLMTSDGQLRLNLRGDSNRIVASGSEEAVVPSRHQFRDVGFVGLASRINAVEKEPEETYEQAVSRNLNQVLGFGASARITAIGNVEVSTAAAARQELQRQLTHDEPIRITVENDFLEDLYVVPEFAD